MLREANGYICHECDVLYEDVEVEALDPVCAGCDEEGRHHQHNTTAVWITDCPVDDVRTCRDPRHHPLIERHVEGLTDEE